MAGMTSEQFEKIMNMVVERLEAGGGSPGLGGGGGRPVLAKHMRCEPFQGGPWSDWAFAFKRGVRSQSPDTFKAMQRVEAMDDAIDESVDVPAQQEARSGELYDVLCQYCTGEALGIVKATTDMQGFAAWQKFHRKYNPRTMARGVRLLGKVVSPPRVKELSDVEAQVNRWEEELGILVCPSSTRTCRTA